MDQCNVLFDFGDQIPVWFLVQAQWIGSFCSGSLDGSTVTACDIPPGIAGVTPTLLCGSPAHTVPGRTGVTILPDTSLNRKPNSANAVLKDYDTKFPPVSFRYCRILPCSQKSHDISAKLPLALRDDPGPKHWRICAILTDFPPPLSRVNFDLCLWACKSKQEASHPCSFHL